MSSGMGLTAVAEAYKKGKKCLEVGRLRYATEGTLKVARARQRGDVGSYKGNRASLGPYY